MANGTLAKAELSVNKSRQESGRGDAPAGRGSARTEPTRRVQPESSALLTDLYQLTILQGYNIPSP